MVHGAGCEAGGAYRRWSMRRTSIRRRSSTSRNRARQEKLGNIKEVLGTPDDAKLPEHSVDDVLLLKVYHEIARPVPFMQKLRASLATGGRVAIVDRNGNGTDHGLNRDVVEKEMSEAGYKRVGLYDFTKADGQDYFLIFQAK